DDRRLVELDDLGQRREQVVVVAAGRADVLDVRARRHRVHGLDVEGLLAVPAVAAAVTDRVRRGGARTLGAADVRELAAPEARCAVTARVRVGVRLQRRGVERVDDRDGLPLAGQAGARDAVRAAELRRRVAAGGVRKRLAVELRQGLGLLLAVVGRALGVVDER